MSRPGHPAGWYRDPERLSGHRYWDGEEWLEDGTAIPDASGGDEDEEPTPPDDDTRSGGQES